jgi:hypothetical protein
MIPFRGVAMSYAPLVCLPMFIVRHFLLGRVETALLQEQHFLPKAQAFFQEEN